MVAGAPALWARAAKRGALQMPEISRFFGIIITMNYNDHSPPHFHARERIAPLA